MSGGSRTSLSRPSCFLPTLNQRNVDLVRQDKTHGTGAFARRLEMPKGQKSWRVSRRRTLCIWIQQEGAKRTSSEYSDTKIAFLKS